MKPRVQDPTSSPSKYNTRLARLETYSEIGNPNTVNIRHLSAFISRGHIAMFEIGCSYLKPWKCSSEERVLV